MISDTTAVAKALSDASRVRAFMAIQAAGDLCVCQITEFLGLATATVSRHMSVLYSALLVGSYKTGRWVHYTSVSGEDGPIPGCALQWITDLCAGDPQIVADKKRLPLLSRCQ